MYSFGHQASCCVVTTALWRTGVSARKSVNSIQNVKCFVAPSQPRKGCPQNLLYISCPTTTITNTRQITSKNAIVLHFHRRRCHDDDITCIHVPAPLQCWRRLIDRFFFHVCHFCFDNVVQLEHSVKILICAPSRTRERYQQDYPVTPRTNARMGRVDRNWTKSGGRPSPMARGFVSG